MTITRLAFGIVTAVGIAAAQPSAPDVIGAVIDGISNTGSPCVVQSWAFGATNATPAGGAGTAPKAQISPLVLTRQLDFCSPKLFGAATTGQHIAKVVLTQYADATMRGEVMVITLTGVTVANYQLSGAAGTAAPAETVGFTYGRIQFEYFPPTGGGSIKVGYDITTQKSL